MNVSSAYIANHTALELFASVNTVILFTLRMDAGFRSLKYSGPAGAVLCAIFPSATLIGVGNIGGRGCIVIHTLDRYWKIVYPIHHRKYYRRWMLYFGLALAWLLGMAVHLPLTGATSRVVNGVCLPTSFWASEAANRVGYAVTAYETNTLLALSLPSYFGRRL